MREGRLLLHEDLDELRAQGVSLTGPAATVDDVVAGLTVLSQQRLDSTRSVMAYGAFDDARRAAAEAASLELRPVAVQDPAWYSPGWPSSPPYASVWSRCSTASPGGPISLRMSAALALGGGNTVVAVGLCWALARDMPLRTRTS